MQAVIFTGIQATGKSTYFKQKFFDSHIRINLDMLKTRRREWKLFMACLQTGQKCVIDNTNPTAYIRSRYINPAKECGFEIVGYYFESKIAEALKRNENRTDKPKIPEKGVQSTHAILEIPSYAEGYDHLFYVRIGEEGEFVVENWME